MTNSQTNPELVCIYKPLGKTPLQALDLMRKHPQYAKAILSYAGRLDPLAEGLLLIMVNTANKDREQYLNLNKTYEFEMVCGLATDTADVLGLVTHKIDVQPHREQLEAVLDQVRGDISLPYPAYSSKTVKGKPLLAWARAGRLHEIKIPEAVCHIYNLEILNSESIDSEAMLQTILQRIDLVDGDFRQEAIKKRWQQTLSQSQQFQKFSFRITCSSGTYVRSVVTKIGELLAIPTVTYSIKRTEIEGCQNLLFLQI